MRSVVVLSLLLAFCASASAATMHRARRHAVEASRMSSFARMRDERRTVAQPAPVTAAPFINLDATEMAPAGY
ncbi:hypothetical protein [Bradyrhizobium sp.]|uniref:hypothetical protein n=1 Tax=Bradyrhizobium sp. TaxID=376 RepID=UPI003C36316F